MTKETKANEELWSRVSALEARYNAKVKELDLKLARMMTVICNLAPTNNIAKQNLRKYLEMKD